MNGTGYKDNKYKIPGIQCRTEQFGENIETVVIGFHGWTGDEHSLVLISTGINLKNSLWIFPRAPYKAQEISKGYSWFNKIPVSRGDFLSAVEFVQKIIDWIETKFEDTIKIFFLGFSQGATLATAIALQLGAKVKGIVSIAGFLNQSKMERFKIFNNQSSNLSFLILHGNNDKIVPVIKSVELKEILEKSGHDVSLVTYNAGHTLPVSYFNQIRIFLDK